MNPPLSKNLGCAFDNLDYAEKLSEQLGSKITPISMENLYIRTFTDLKPFGLRNKRIGIILIYSEIKNVGRIKMGGLELVKQIRMAGYNNPVIVLSWFSVDYLIGRFGITNPFICGSSRSLKILQLPIRISEVKENISSLFPLSMNEYRRQIKSYESWEISNIRHDLKTIVCASTTLADIKNNLFEYSSKHSQNNKIKKLVNALLMSENIKSIQSTIESLK